MKKQELQIHQENSLCTILVIFFFLKLFDSYESLVFKYQDIGVPGKGFARTIILTHEISKPYFILLNLNSVKIFHFVNSY